MNDNCPIIGIVVDSEMFINENNNQFTNFTLASSIFNIKFDRKEISTINIIKKVNDSIDIDIVFESCIETIDNTNIDNLGQSPVIPVASTLFVKTNNAFVMRFNLASPIFNPAFRAKNIIAIDLFKNFDDSVDIDIAYQQLVPISPSKPVDSRMAIKNSTSNTLKFNLASSVFDNTFDLRPILSSDIIKKRDGSIDISIIFQSLDTFTQLRPSNPAYRNPVINDGIVFTQGTL